MARLYLFGGTWDDSQTLAVIRAARTAMVHLSGQWVSASSAADVINQAIAEGNVLLGENTDEKVAWAADQLKNAGAEFSITGDDEPPEAEEVSPEPSDVSMEGFKTAIALMGSAEGNPLVACAQARILWNTAADARYKEAILALCSTFEHFLPEMVAANELWPDDDEG